MAERRRLKVQRGVEDVLQQPDREERDHAPPDPHEAEVVLNAKVEQADADDTSYEVGARQVREVEAADVDAIALHDVRAHHNADDALHVTDCR